MASETLEEIDRARVMIADLTSELEKARKLIRELVDDEDAGVVWTGTRVVCAYCSATDRYAVEHDRDCPIERARRALGLCADRPAGDPLEETIRQIDRLTRELEAARKRERTLREAILAELHGAGGIPLAEIGPDGVQRLWEALIQTEARDA